ncbi:MAG: ferritin [Kiritimatiellae bacterium]|jgi:ferritin|nr:ferritin [Kiritimatiellia bacterium]NLD89455.1 ferritin [Lentisphaerota bacterium]HOU21053.1 ferritin [Kiritimatiellia bacterium]HQN80316.1 ferritin [Kiritimatiellia bacterium]HQQ61196.1 ferritin [Kiritimatiellia bacterium]
MISKKMAQEINAQINREFFSAFLYLAMANDAVDKGFNGTARWMTLQFEEEQEHALKFAKYLQDQGEKVVLGAMDAPQTEWSSILAMFQDALAHEKKVTAWINDLYTLALEEKDYATQSMLKWFIDEQVEEEANCNEAIAALSMVSKSVNGTFMYDRQLGKRKED